MFHCRSRWSPRYAFGYASAGDATPSRRNAFYESRQHRSSGFGVRRPLRYLGYRLDLDDTQMRRVAAVLDGLKTEREQAKLDEARSLTDVASLVTKDGLSVDDLQAALVPRVRAAERLQLAVARAVQDIVSVLDAEQREEFAYLLNSKALTL